MALHELVLAQLEVKVAGEGLPALRVGDTAPIRHEEEGDGPLEASIEIGQELECALGLGKDVVALLQNAVDVKGEREGGRNGDRSGSSCVLACETMNELRSRSAEEGTRKTLKEGREEGHAEEGYTAERHPAPRHKDTLTASEPHPQRPGEREHTHARAERQRRHRDG